MYSTRICKDCQKFQNGVCTEDGMFASDGGTCDRWRYRYEPLVFLAARMRRIQRKRNKDWKDKQEQAECEQALDRMLDEIEQGTQ